jgi:hypothetical protein
MENQAINGKGLDILEEEGLVSKEDIGMDVILVMIRESLNIIYLDHPTYKDTPYFQICEDLLKIISKYSSYKIEAYWLVMGILSVMIIQPEDVHKLNMIMVDLAKKEG